MENISSLAAALVKAQAEMSGAKKDSANPFFKSKYADLSSVMEAIRPALTAHKLAFVQICHDSPGAARIETVIIHESGETLSCGTISVPVSKEDAQGYGSAISYAKRYSLQAAFGVPSVDDDGNAAAKAVPVATPKPAPKLISPPIATEHYNVTNERAEAIFEAAAASVDQFKLGNLDAAYDEISGITDNGEKLFLWAIIKEYSALRSAIKSRWAEAVKAEV